MVKLLIEKGALLFRDEKGRTAVHIAAVNGFTGRGGRSPVPCSKYST